MTQHTQLPPRTGPRPQAYPTVPHMQITDNSPPEVYAELARWLFALPSITEGRSAISAPSSRAAWIGPEVPIRAGMNREFTHLHTEPGPGSQHACVDKELAAEIVAKGWGELHPFNDRVPTHEVVLIYAPRDTEELEVIKQIVERAYAVTTGVSLSSTP